MYRCGDALRSENALFGSTTYAKHFWVRYRPTMSIVRHTSHEFVGWQQYVTRFTHGLSHDGLHGSVTHDYWRERRADDNTITGVELRPLLTTGTGSRRKAPPAYKQMAIRGFVPVPYPSIFNGWSGAQRRSYPWWRLSASLVTCSPHACGDRARHPLPNT